MGRAFVGRAFVGLCRAGPGRPTCTCIPVEPPVVADAGMAEVPLLEVVSDLPSLGHKERATAIAEFSDRKPASLAEGKPSTL